MDASPAALADSGQFLFDLLERYGSLMRFLGLGFDLLGLLSHLLAHPIYRSFELVEEPEGTVANGKSDVNPEPLDYTP
jgi:hypothetical protein